MTDAMVRIEKSFKETLLALNAQLKSK